MTLAEKLAAKRAAAAGVACVWCGQPSNNGSYDSKPCCMTCYESGKANRAGITIKPDASSTDDEYRDPPSGELMGRRLAAQEDSGERIPLRHDGDAGWRKACHAVDSQLCIVIGPGPKDEAWIGIAPTGDVQLHPPLLLHRLPLVILPGSFDPF
jgi:hypothetical protein